MPATVSLPHGLQLLTDTPQIQIDELTSHYGMTPNDYTAVRCGMNVSKAIIRGEIDAGIGLENVQMVEGTTSRI